MASALKVPALPASLTTAAERRVRRLSSSGGKRSVGAAVGAADANKSRLCTDDFAELARVEQQRALAARRSKASRADPALLSMFASTMKLAQTGKITHRNAFQLQLIDHMADIIQQPDEADAAPARQTPLKASQKHSSATGTPLSATSAFATPSARSASPARSAASPASVRLRLTPSSGGQPAKAARSAGRGAAAGNVNFVKASSTLDASVMIYSGRVDNVHKDAYRMAGGLTAQRRERDEEDGGGAATDGEADGAEAAGRAARRKRRAAATIETRLASLNMKQVERREDGDPFFKRMGAAFDAGGAKGLLTHQLSVYRGAEVALDGQLQPLLAAEQDGRAADGLTQHVDLTELSELLRATASNWRQLTVCPIMRELEAVRRELEGKPAHTDDEDSTAMDTAHVAGLPADGQCAAADSDDELAAGFGGLELAGSGGAGGLDLSELRAEIDAAIVQEQCLDSHMARPMDDGDGDEDVSAPSAATATEAAFAAIAPGLFGAPTGGSGSAHWQMAAMAHWKFKDAATAPAASNHRQPRQIKATAPIDFYAAPPPASALAAVPNKRLASLRLSAATLRRRMEPAARAALMRPAAATYSVERLMALYGRDSSVSIRDAPGERTDEREEARQDERRATEGGGTEEGTGSADGWDDLGGEDDDAAADFEPTGAAPPPATTDPRPDFALLAAPQQAQRLSIGYAQAAKRVDVKQLKDCLWRGMSAADDAQQRQAATGEERDMGGWEERGSKATVGPITFQRAIDTLAGRYPERQLAAVSVPYCFICVLHLCNEQGLVLESDPLPTADTAAGDRSTPPRANLSSFTIRPAH